LLTIPASYYFWVSYYTARFSEHGKYQLRYREVRDLRWFNTSYDVTIFFFHRLESKQVF